MSNTSRSNIYLPGILAVIFIFSAAGDYMVRDLWFDEALTLQNFALLPSIKSIYLNYVIPNNQLIYTMMLHYWVKFYPGIFDLASWMRLLSISCALVTLLFIFCRFRVIFGKGPLFIVLCTLACSPPFLLHATALRGYMAGAMFIVLALGAAADLAVSGKKMDFLKYFIFSFLAAGVLPSNLMALGAAVLYVTPSCGRYFYRKKRFWVLVLTPPAAMLLFYLPIWDSLLRVFAVGSSESWHDISGVTCAVYLSQIFTYCMLFLPVTAAVFFRKSHGMFRIFRGAIWLIPLAVIVVLPSPPFPRVFFPLFPIFALLVAAGLKDFSAYFCRLHRRFNPKVWFGGLLVLILSWSAVQQIDIFRNCMSFSCGGAGRDDFYRPYYMRAAHMPSQTAAALAEKPGFTSVPRFFYLTFNSDPWPLMFYLRMNDIQVKDFLFDGPRGQVPTLPDDSVVILNVSADSQEDLSKRFPGEWRFIFKNRNHQIWSYRR